MKFVLCDAEEYLRTMVEALVERLDHDVVGVADNPAIATELVRRARPDVVIVDLSLGYNTDFDIVGAAAEVGARVVVFSHSADHDMLDRYSPKPIVVEKPDLRDLERALSKVQATTAGDGEIREERRKPLPPSAAGPAPADSDDAHAFYAAVGNTVPGDALLSIDAAGGPALTTADAERITDLIRDTDRILVTGSSLKVFLPGGDAAGIEAFVDRIRAGASDLAPRVQVRSIVVEPDEGSADAFARLKAADPLRP